MNNIGFVNNFILYLMLLNELRLQSPNLSKSVADSPHPTAEKCLHNPHHCNTKESLHHLKATAKGASVGKYSRHIARSLLFEKLNVSLLPHAA